MARLVRVADPDDSRLTLYRHLTDAELRRRVEDQTGSFAVEGLTAIRRLLVSAYRTRSLLLTEAKADALQRELAGADVDVFVAPLDVMRTVVGFDIHRGAVAMAVRPPPLDVRDVVLGARLIAVLEGLNDHENLGAVVRSAAGLGVDALLLDPTCADPLYRRSVRVSMGEILFMPFARLAPWPDRLDLLRDLGITIVALTPAPEAQDLADVAARLHDQPVAIVLGAEGPGLSAVALAAADARVRIPLRPGVDSLNVGHAAAIAFDRFGSRPRRPP